VNYIHSTPIEVNEGDLIHGVMEYNWHPYGYRWTITTEVNGINTYIHTYSFDDRNKTEQVALECLGADEDDDLPGDTLFINLYISNNGRRVDVDWKEEIDPVDAAHFNNLHVQVYSDYTVKLYTAN